MKRKKSLYKAFLKSLQSVEMSKREYLKTKTSRIVE